MLRALAIVLFVAACGTEETSDGPTQPVVDPDLDPALISERPYGLKVPVGYAGESTPLILTLHGLGWTGITHVNAMGLFDLADTHGFLLAYPDGTSTALGRLWNASCCDTSGLGFDDVHYLRAVIADVKERYNVDPGQVYVQGLSNGAFMAYVLACEAADVVAAITPLAGSMWVQEIDLCQPSAPVAIMHTHGTEDDTVAYGGGSFYGFDYVSVVASVDHWRDSNACSGSAAASTADVDGTLAGEETAVQRWNGCGAPVELWTVQGAGRFLLLTRPPKLRSFRLAASTDPVPTVEEVLRLIDESAEAASVLIPSGAG